MSSLATPAQIRAIHTLKSRARMPDEHYRALLAGHGVESSKSLSMQGAIRVIDQLKAASTPAGSRPASATVTGRYADKLRALWISGWNLGVVRERDDRALLAFVERQTGLTHTRFLTDPADARRAIEALKSWLAREAGVRWPLDRQDEGWGAKLAVSAAMVLRAQALGVRWPDGLSAEDIINDPDRCQPILGRAIRAAMKRRG